MLPELFQITPGNQLFANSSLTDVGQMRPYINSNNGKRYVTINGEAVPAPAATPMIHNATLRDDEWKYIDEQIRKAARVRLRGVQHLIARGLVQNTGGLGKMVHQYEDLDDEMTTTWSMDGLTRGENQRPNYEVKYTPLPICHADFQINARALAASRAVGESIDTTMGERAGFRVSEAVETLLFQGTGGITYGGGTIYGYENYTNRVTGSKTADPSDSGGAIGQRLLTDVLAMKQAAINKKHYGPYMLYLGTDWETSLGQDFKADSDKTVMSRIKEIDNIIDVSIIDKMSSATELLVQMTSDVVRLLNGLAITVIQWSSEGNMVTNYKVMCIMVPQIRSDQANNTGIIHYT